MPRTRRLDSIVLFLSLCLACFTGSVAAQELQVWAMGAEGKLIREMADRFEAANPGVTVVTQAVSWGSAHEKLVTSIVGNMEPDVCQLGTTWMAEFHTMGALEPIAPWLASSSIKLTEFFPASLDSNRFNGEYYGVPWYVDTRVFFYRTDLASAAGFARFPETWTELKTLAHNLKRLKSERGIPGFVYGPGIGDWQMLLMYFWQCGGEIQPDLWPGPIIDGESLREALEHIISFYDEGLSHREKGGEQELLAGTESGYYPMYVSGPWLVNDLESRPGLKGRWTTAPLPRHRRGTSFLGGSNLVMFRGSKQKPLAWKFIEFMSSASNQALWYEISRDLPARQSAWLLPALAERPHLEAFRRQLLDARAPPALPEWEAMAERLSHRYTEVMHGHRGIAEGIALVQEECGLIIERSGIRPGVPFSWPLGLSLMLIPAFLAMLYLRTDPAQPPSPRLRSRVWPFLLPALLLILAFRFFPGAACLVTSFTNWDIYGIQDPGR
ncbi:MAG TPA: sugar ABC transporter substrate-binding protein, partial [Candidatus Ozemobacteraceae bacterium]|nr:sugar ABC transporter substrate-binding protein [Candidatus Ozemobacteraceae bacterium]